MKRRSFLMGMAALTAGLVAASHPVLRAQAAGWPYTTLYTNTYPVNGSFARIQLTETSSDVTFRPSEDGSARVVCREAEDLPHTVKVENGLLTITASTSLTPHLYHGDGPKVIVYLPDADYEALTVSVTSGDVLVDSGLRFGTVQITATSGDAECYAAVSGTLSIDTSSGNIELSSQSTGSVQLHSTSGDIEVKGLQASSFGAVATSGDIDLSQVQVQGELRAETTSGDIEVEASDAASMTLKSTSGDIEAELLSPKNFQVSGGRGRVQAPQSNPAAGLCTVQTTSGEIQLRVRG